MYFCFLGRSYVVTSHKTLMQGLESIVQKIQPGVVINFEKFGPDPDPVSRDGMTIFHSLFLTSKILTKLDWPNQETWHLRHYHM